MLLLAWSRYPQRLFISYFLLSLLARELEHVFKSQWDLYMCLKAFLNIVLSWNNTTMMRVVSNTKGVWCLIDLFIYTDIWILMNSFVRFLYTISGYKTERGMKFYWKFLKHSMLPKVYPNQVWNMVLLLSLPVNQFKYIAILMSTIEIPIN